MPCRSFAMQLWNYEPCIPYFCYSGEDLWCNACNSILCGPSIELRCYGLRSIFCCPGKAIILPLQSIDLDLRITSGPSLCKTPWNVAEIQPGRFVSPKHGHACRFTVVGLTPPLSPSRSWVINPHCRCCHCILSSSGGSSPTAIALHEGQAMHASCCQRASLAL